MKRFLILAAAAAVAATAAFADVGVSVSIGQPGFYGRLDLGDYPQPRLIYRQPILIDRVSTGEPPIYLRVPPGHAKHWGKHCGKYNACGERVLFVRDDWYSREYAPRYREEHRDRRDERDERRNDHRRNDKHDRGNDRSH